MKASCIWSGDIVKIRNERETVAKEFNSIFWFMTTLLFYPKIINQIILIKKFFLKQSWIQAKPIEGCILVNVADLLERFTNGLFPATRHRWLKAKSNCPRLWKVKRSIKSEFSLSYCLKEYLMYDMILVNVEFKCFCNKNELI